MSDYSVHSVKAESIEAKRNLFETFCTLQIDFRSRRESVTQTGEPHTITLYLALDEGVLAGRIAEAINVAIVDYQREQEEPADDAA